jgi:hypothetical protein
MRNIFSVSILSLACTFALVAVPVHAQTPAQPPASQPPPRAITYRGLELGVDVTAGRRGEVGFNFGAASNHGTLAVRFSAMDADTAVPCSLGVMYERLFRNDRARITPVVGASFGRVFSCASNGDGPRPTPTAHSLGTISGGVRVPMFAGRHVVGSLKVLAFGQRQFAADSAGDVSSRGVTVGFVVGRR